MARFDRWCPELESALAAPFPDDVMERKKAGRKHVKVVPWHAYVYRLNSLVGPHGWSQEDPIIQVVGNKLVMAVPVTILGVRHCNVGSEQRNHGDPETVPDGEGGEKKVVRDFGSAETNSFAQALKRTLALFGMGLDQYDESGAVRAMVEREEKADLARLLDYLKVVGPRLSEGDTGMIGGEEVVLQPIIRERWQAVKQSPILARAYVREVERASGIPFAEVHEHRRSRATTAAR